MESTESKATVFADGFGGMAVVDTSELDENVISHLNKGNVWDVFDGAEKLPRGRYIISLKYWRESNFPEPGDSFCSDWTGCQRLLSELA